MKSLKTKVVVEKQAKFLYKYRGNWKNPVIYSMEVLPLSFPRLSERFNDIVQITEYEDF